MADLHQVELVIGRHQTEKPSVADVIPDDPVVTAWKLRQEQLTERRTSLISYLNECRSQHAIAQSRERAARNQLNEAKLYEVRRELKEVRSQFERMKGVIERFDLKVREIERAITNVNEEIGKLHALRGSFPDRKDPDFKASEREEKRLLSRREELFSEKRSGPDRMEALRLQRRLEELVQQERNLVDELHAGHAETRAAHLTIGSALPAYSGSGVR